MKRKSFFRSGLILILALIVFGCQKEKNINAEVVLSPSDLILNDDQTAILYLSVQPASEFQWNLSAKPAWLEITPVSGTINKNIVELLVTPNLTGLSQGQHYGTIEIITNGAGTARSYVHLNVGERPIASVNPTTISYGANESVKTLTVANTGTGVLGWELNSLPDWINVNVSSGVLNEGESTNIIATANRSGLAAGTQTAQAVLVSNSAGGNTSIDFSIEVASQAYLSTSPANLIFGYFESSKTLSLANNGNIACNWTWDNQHAYLSASPTSGSLSPGASIQITFEVDRTGFSPGSIEVETVFTNSAGPPATLPITINHYQEEKWLIDGRVIDAEYDRVNDVIIVVSETPNQIRKFNSTQKSFSSLALNMIPTCVSVSQDGQFAAVGHSGKISYVNLTTMELVQMYDVTANAYDIVLAPNNWVYVFPRDGQWQRIRCINLSTGAETLHTGNQIYSSSKAKLHTSGNYIYVASNLSPSNVDKFDISSGTAQYMHRSPYHGQYEFSGDHWISDDGNRLFASSRNVFHLSESQSNDLTYSGVLAGQGNGKTLDHSTNAGKVYAVFQTGIWGTGPPDNKVHKYSSNFLNYLGDVVLPDFFFPDGTGGGAVFSSEGHFGFFNAAGTKFYVLVKAKEGSGAQNEWAIVTIVVD